MSGIGTEFENVREGKFRTSISIRQKTLNEMKAYEIKNKKYDFSTKVDHMISDLLNLHKLGVVELENKLTYRECVLILGALNGFSFPQSNYLDVLYLEIKNSIKVNKIDEDYRVDKDTLLEKISNLTQHQAYTVLCIVEEFFNSGNKIVKSEIMELFNTTLDDE